MHRYTVVGKCTVQSSFQHSYYRVYSTSLLYCVVHCAAGIAVEAELSMVCLVAEFRGFFVAVYWANNIDLMSIIAVKMESTRGVLRMETHLATCLSILIPVLSAITTQFPAVGQFGKGTVNFLVVVAHSE